MKGSFRDDFRKKAINSVITNINAEVASNLTKEATLWILESSTNKRNTNEYWGNRNDVPVASKLASEFGIIWVDLTGEGAPCMIVQVPFQNRQHPCKVYVIIKPNGGYNWGNEYVKYNNEIVLKVVQR